jgi:hypothetical protein
MFVRRWFAIAFLPICFFAYAQPGRAARPDTDPALDVPPAGLVASKVTLSQVLAAHDKANQPAAGSRDTVVERWSFTDSGLAGTEVLQRSGSNYRSTLAAGPFVDRYGQIQDIRWHQDDNGFTSVTTQIDARSFYAVRVLEDAADPKNDVTVAGQTTGERPAWVLRIKRSGYRHPEWVFYDEANGQVVRVEYVGSKRRNVETYDDFRNSGGIVRSWHMHDTDGRPELDDDWTLDSIQRGVTLPDSTFAMPPYHPTVSAVTAATAIPDRRTGWGNIVRVNVKGRGLDFLLDSAAGVSTIDRNVAHDLGLPDYGQTTRLKDGHIVNYRTMLADADVGGIHLHDFALQTEDFAWNPDEKTRIVGELGYDFFAANVLHFDNVNGTLEALPAAAFTAPVPVPGGVDVPIQLDDGVPLVPMYIGNTLTNNVVLDTALPLSLISGTFALNHPADVVDMSRGSHNHAMVPFADDNSYGIRAETWYARSPTLQFAISNYTDKLVIAANFPFLIHDKEVDGFVGIDYLRYYDLYFAYPYGRLIVKPNARMRLVKPRA